MGQPTLHVKQAFAGRFSSVQQHLRAEASRRYIRGVRFAEQSSPMTVRKPDLARVCGTT